MTCRTMDSNRSLDLNLLLAFGKFGYFQDNISTGLRPQLRAPLLEESPCCIPVSLREELNLLCRKRACRRDPRKRAPHVVVGALLTDEHKLCSTLLESYSHCRVALGRRVSQACVRGASRANCSKIRRSPFTVKLCVSSAAAHCP